MRTFVFLALACLASLACRNGDGSGGDAGPRHTPNGADASSPGLDGSHSPDGARPWDGEGPRDDPGTFPSECLGCEQACERMAECDALGGGSGVTDVLDCMDRCFAAADFADSDTFRCCLSQPSCEDVRTCGAWAAHPATEAPCSRQCDCQDFASRRGAVRGPEPGTSPPDGTRWEDEEAIVRTDELPAPLKHKLGLESRYVRLPARLVEAQPRLARFRLPTVRDTRGRLAALESRLVVRCSDRRAEAAVRREVGKAGLRELHYGRGLFRVEAGAALETLHLYHRLRQLGRAHGNLEVEIDMVRLYRKRGPTNDPLLDAQWHLANEGQAGGIPGADARVLEAWDMTRGSDDVVIAVIDDGVRVDHPDLASRSLPPLGFPAGWETDPYFGSHGTAVAGVAVAEADNAEGGAGVCPGCRLLGAWLPDEPPVGDEEFGMADTEVADVFAEVVDAGAWVISNSWGPADGDPAVVDEPWPAEELPLVLEAALDYAEDEGRNGKGSVILFAAGNGNEPIDDDPLAAHPTVLAVGAVDDHGLKATYSDFGEALDIVAPSDGGLAGIVTTGLDHGGGPYEREFGGTSASCPVVAGVAGLVLSANPDLTAAEVRDILRRSAARIDPVWGAWGDDGRSPYYGAGLVHAFRAVAMALGDCADPADCIAPSDVCSGACAGAACHDCRTGADCAEGFICQAVPSVGRALCVPRASDGPCADGSTRVGDYCLPDPASCRRCGEVDPCNGRDDDCNGVVDDAGGCGLPRCFDASACAADEVCSLGVCVPTCTDSDDCDGAPCAEATDRYGRPTGDQVCSYDPYGDHGLCVAECSAVVSSLPEDEIREFAECVEAAASCSASWDCPLPF